MSTSIKKSLIYGKTYSFNAQADNYYDYSEIKTISKETENPINITMEKYDGLKYKIYTDKSECIRLSLGNTILPNRSELQTTNYCLENIGTNVMISNLEFIGCIDPDMNFKKGTNVTFKCFANGNTNIILTNKDSYENYRYLGEIPYTSPSTLKFGDRIDNKATVISTFRNHVYAVLDARYRSMLPWATGLAYVESGLPIYHSSEYVLSALETATQNTSYIINKHKNKQIESFTYCRSIEDRVVFNNTAYNCQLPNAYEVQEIYNNRAKLDVLDVSLAANTDKGLSDWKFGGGYGWVWSSNEGSEQSDMVGTTWALDSYGSWYGFHRESSNIGCVVPIIEIPINSEIS